MQFKKIKNLSNDLYKKEVAARQSKSASRTADIKRLKTAGRIRATVEALLRKSIKLTYANIAKYAKISLRTVKNNTKIVRFFTQKINGAISSIRVIALGAEGRSTNLLKCFFLESVGKVILTLQIKGVESVNTNKIYKH
ncbi:MAG: hypothetical protein NTZ60_00930 [Campylobacterales bacterium]|nr:hypothetical protein [Campylobacterales bacterium]